MRNITPSITFIVLAILIGMLFYPLLPQKVASHWDAQGNVNGYMSKFWGIFLLPMIMFACTLLFILLPYLDPLKENIEKFRKHYDFLIIAISIFFFYLYLLMLLYNLGFQFSMTQWLMPALSGLMYSIGIVLKNAKRNWFVGIRTPWTLSSDLIWDKTHALGSKLFKAVAVITLLGILLPKIAIILLIAPLLISTVWLFIYSYVLYKKNPPQEQIQNNRSNKKYK